MNLTRKPIIDELESINEQEKNIVKIDTDVKNNWAKLKVKRSPWYIAAQISIILLIVMIGFQIALLIRAENIWHAQKDQADLYSMIFSLIMTFWTLLIYIILIYKGKEDISYNTVAFKNNTVYKERSNISKKNYWLSNFALVILVFNFFLFYGFVGLITSTTHTYQSLSAIFSILSIIVPAAAVPLGMQYINKHNAERQIEKKYHDWIRLNVASKYNILKKADFKKNIDYLQISKDLEMDEDILVFDSKSIGEVKKNIVLYNNIQLEELRDLLTAYNDNLNKRADLYKNIKWKRSKKSGKIIINSSIKNTATINRIKKLNNRNTILVSIIYKYYHERFE